MKHQIKSLAFTIFTMLSFVALGQNNGSIEPQTYDDLIAIYGKDAQEKSWQVLWQPKISPDGNIYIFSARIEKSEAKNAFLGLTSGAVGDRYYSLNEVPNKLLKKYELNARVNGYVTVAGRYVGNITYRTISGETKTAPKFLIEHIIF